MKDFHGNCVYKPFFLWGCFVDTFVMTKNQKLVSKAQPNHYKKKKKNYPKHSLICIVGNAMKLEHKIAQELKGIIVYFTKGGKPFLLLLIGAFEGESSWRERWSWKKWNFLYCCQGLGCEPVLNLKFLFLFKTFFCFFFYGECEKGDIPCIPISEGNNKPSTQFGGMQL